MLKELLYKVLSALRSLPEKLAGLLRSLKGFDYRAVPRAITGAITGTITEVRELGLRGVLLKAKKSFVLIPIRYWNIAAALVAVFVAYQVVTALRSPLPIPSVSSTSKKTATLTPFAEKETTLISSLIGEGNLFRVQRKDHEIPPPVVEEEIVVELEELPLEPEPEPEPTEDVVADIILRGTIVTDDARMAIMDGEVKEYIQVEVPWHEVMSGVQQGRMEAGKQYYTRQSVGSKKLEGQTFHEGEEISNYVIERVNDMTVDVVHLFTGKHQTVYMDPKQKDKAAKESLSRTGELKGVPRNAPPDDDLSALSGARM